MSLRPPGAPRTAASPASLLPAQAGIRAPAPRSPLLTPRVLRCRTRPSPRAAGSMPAGGRGHDPPPFRFASASCRLPHRSVVRGEDPGAATPQARRPSCRPGPSAGGREGASALDRYARHHPATRPAARAQRYFAPSITTGVSVV